MADVGQGSGANPPLTRIDPLWIEPMKTEQHQWVARADGMSSRAQIRRGSGTYRSAIPARIANYQPELPSDLAADLDEATAALARCDSYTAATFPPDTQMAPMRAVLLRTEATSSSQIENLTVGARQLALAEIDQATSVNAKLVVANVHLMQRALALSDRLDESSILGMHRELFSGDDRMGAGEYRRELVWVGTSGVSPLGAAHVGPQAELIAELMADLVRFLDRDDLPALLQATIAHAQFETIHPFADGNGRVGRALVQAVLANKGLLTRVSVPVSAGLLVNTSSYFDALTAFREGNVRPIVERFTAASRFAAIRGAQLIDDLNEELQRARQKLSHLRSDATAWRVLPHLAAHPVINVAFLIEELGVGEMSAHRAIRQLSERGVVEERTGKSRNRVWQHSGIIDVLDGFAEGIRRI